MIIGEAFMIAAGLKLWELLSKGRGGSSALLLVRQFETADSFVVVEAKRYAAEWSYGSSRRCCGGLGFGEMQLCAGVWGVVRR